MTSIVTIPPELRKALENHALSLFPLPGSIILGGQARWCAFLGGYMIHSYGLTPEEAISNLEAELVSLETQTTTESEIPCP